MLAWTSPTAVSKAYHFFEEVVEALSLCTEQRGCRYYSQWLVGSDWVRVRIGSIRVVHTGCVKPFFGCVVSRGEREWPGGRENPARFSWSSELTLPVGFSLFGTPPLFDARSTRFGRLAASQAAVR